VSVKSRTGPVVDEPADHGLPHWAGVVPLRLTAGRPEPDAGVTVPVPGYLRPRRSPWLTAAPLRGGCVVLEPLDRSHAADLFAAADDPDVWRHLSARRPDSVAAMAELVDAALAAHDRGERVPWVQRSAVTGKAVGATSYYDVDEARRSVAIGYTWLGRPWWGTGLNTEAKLLLLTRAFDDLGAVRVFWHTDIRNDRSQRAIERLGARREGVLRMHMQRPDGTWRDTVQYSMTVYEWPTAQATLRKRISAGAAAA